MHCFTFWTWILSRINRVWHYKKSWSKSKSNKKVLLRERKRHTDHGISSTPSVVLYQGDGVPLERGVPPYPRLDGAPPVQGWMGYPLFKAHQVVFIIKWWRYPPSKAGWGTPLAGPDWGTPCGQTDRHMSKHNLPVILYSWSVKSEAVHEVQFMSTKHSQQGVRVLIKRSWVLSPLEAIFCAEFILLFHRVSLVGSVASFVQFRKNSVVMWPSCQFIPSDQSKLHSPSSFPVILKINNVGISVLPKFENKLHTIIYSISTMP